MLGTSIPKFAYEMFVCELSFLERSRMTQDQFGSSHAMKVYGLDEITCCKFASNFGFLTLAIRGS